MKEENPQLKLSLSGFYKIRGKNFKKPVKKTDICPICANGQLIEKKIRAEYMKQYIDEEQIFELQQQYKAYKKHHKLAQYQREEHNKQIQSLDENACVVIMDFKQNLKIGGGRVETSRDFYTKSEITVLGFCVFIRKNEKLIKKQISFVSETLSHDTHFVKSAMKRLIEYKSLKDIEVMHFWSDCAYHFRSKELMYFFDQEFKKAKNTRMITMNFFVEYHGKSQVDSNFGVLTRWFNDGEKYTSIKTMDELICFFQRKALEDQNRKTEYLFVDFSPEKRAENYRKLNIKNIKTYLSFVFLEKESFCSHITTKNRNFYNILSKSYGIIKETRTTRMSIRKGLDKPMGRNTIKALDERFNILTKVCNSIQV